MQVQEKETHYAGIVKLFGFVLSQYRLYSEKHPAVQLAVRDFFGRLETTLGSASTLTLGFVGGQLVVNDHPLDNKKIGVADLLRECQRLQIESLTFYQGVGEGEVSSFFKMMAIPPKALEQMGGFKKVLEEANFEHIRLGTARYQMIKEEEAVVSKSEIGDGEGEAEEKEESLIPEQVRRIERMEEVVEHYIRGTEGEIEIDVERLAYELEKKTEGVAGQMVKRAEDLGALKRIVHGMGYFLQERLAQPFVQEGKDFSQPISRLAKEFKKAVESPEAPIDFKASVEELVGILERCADAVKLDLIVRIFQESGGDVKSLAKIGAKFLRSKEARDKLLGPLREKVGALGIGEKDFGQVFATVEERRASKKSRQLDVSPEELEELRQIRDHFEEELARRVKEETGVLEREKRRVQDQKERVDTIIRSLGEGLVVVDVEGKIQFMNPAAEKLLGLNQREGKGVPIPQVVKDEHLLALAKGPLWDDADHVTKEIELRSMNDETRRVLQASSAVIENEDGKTVGMVTVLSDITKQKKLDEMKSKFVGHVSHELRTPLMAIQESLALILDRKAGEVSLEQEKFLSIAHQNIARLSRLVNDLLDVAKLEAGKMELHPIPFELGDMVHHAVETVRSWADSKKLTIKEGYPEGIIEMVADPDRLTQVVTNLLSNAVKFTPEGGKISVEIEPTQLAHGIAEEPCVAVSVQDSGIGIPKQHQKRIFEKFEQVSLASPQGVSSTGLGLTIVKEIVELHRGRIWVDSDEGQGSRFTFVIPRQLRNKASVKQGLV